MEYAVHRKEMGCTSAGHEGDCWYSEVRKY